MTSLSKPGRAAVYTRISSDRRGEAAGVARQEEDCRALADKLGWTVVDVLEDNDISAYQRKKSRPAYQRLLAGLRDGTYDGVLAWHSNRLNRRAVELGEFIEIVEDAGAEVATVKSGDLDLTTANGRMVAMIVGTIAQGEVEQTRERVKRQKAQAVASGKWLGGRRPFGYEDDGVTIREPEAEAIRWAAVQLIAGRSMRWITAELNDRGITTTAGNIWRGVSLRAMLLRARNAGLTEQGNDAEWPAVLDRDTWDAVRSILTDPSRRTNNLGRPSVRVGVGTYRCVVCGSTVVAGRNRGQLVYTCPMPERHVVRDLALTDEVVLGVVSGLLARPEPLRALLAPAGPDVDLDGLRTDADALRTRLEGLGADYADGLLTAGQVKTATERIQTRLRDVEDKIGRATAGSQFADLATAPDPAALFMEAEPDRQREIVRALVNVTILQSPRGRPPGWQPGRPYFRPETIRIKPIGYHG